MIVDSNEALDLKLGIVGFLKAGNVLLLINSLLGHGFTVRKQQDIQDEETTFKPEMSHQVFGEK